MSNSTLVSYTKISPNRTSPRRNKIDMIAIHCVVGQVSVESLGGIFASSSKGASSHYGVGYDGRIGQYCDEKDRAWTTGGTDKYGNPIRVNGISGADIDHRAVTIEVASDTTHPYAVNAKAYAALINLCVDICKRNGIKKLLWKGDKSLVGNVAQQNMAVHRWFANKSCPGDYLYNRMGDIANQVNQKLGAGTTTPTTPSIPVADDIVVGSEVIFSGGYHYPSSTSSTGYQQNGGHAKVTKIAKGAAHPYHIVSTNRKETNVYGWVNAGTIVLDKGSSGSTSKPITVGCKVKVTNAVTYDGKSFKLYYDKYDVIQVNGDRVVIGIGKTVTAAVNAKNLVVV